MRGFFGSGGIKPHRPTDEEGNGSVRSVGESLDVYLEEQGFKQVRDLVGIEACWERAVGVDVAAHAVPKGLRDGELLVEVDRPGWATELAFLSEGVLRALNEELGGMVARRLKVHVRA